MEGFRLKEEIFAKEDHIETRPVMEITLDLFTCQLDCLQVTSLVRSIYITISKHSLFSSSIPHNHHPSFSHSPLSLPSAFLSPPSPASPSASTTQ